MTRAQTIVVRRRQRTVTNRALARMMRAPRPRIGQRMLLPPVRSFTGSELDEQTARYQRAADEKAAAMRELVDKMVEMLPDGMGPLLRKVLGL